MFWGLGLIGFRARIQDLFEGCQVEGLRFGGSVRPRLQGFEFKVRCFGLMA